MNFPMRLFRRRPKVSPLPPEEEWTWYAEFDRRRISLKTPNEKAAQRSFERLKKAWLKRNLARLEGRLPTKKLGDFSREFLEWSQETKRHFTYLTDKQAFRKALEYFGSQTKLTSITAYQVDKWLAKMGQEVQRVSANTWFRHFKAAMAKAIEWGYLKKSPCQSVKQLKTDESLPRYLTREEYHRLQAAETVPAFRRLWEIYLRTGRRRGEILRLTAEDIDWKGLAIRIRLKGGRSQRLPITPETATLFRQIPVQVGRLFPWTPNHVTHHFIKTAKAAGVSCRLHDLRHTYGSWMIQAGVDLKVVSNLMGHKNTRTTEIYAYLNDAQLAQAQGKLKIGEE